jgi:hypothetical protein
LKKESGSQPRDISQKVSRDERAREGLYLPRYTPDELSTTSHGGGKQKPPIASAMVSVFCSKMNHMSRAGGQGTGRNLARYVHGTLPHLQEKLLTLELIFRFVSLLSLAGSRPVFFF